MRKRIIVGILIVGAMSSALVADLFLAPWYPFLLLICLITQGLAIARSVASKARAVLLLEAAEKCGTGTSSRNSEVIHAGIYYPTNSLKAKLWYTNFERYPLMRSLL